MTGVVAYIWLIFFKWFICGYINSTRSHGSYGLIRAAMQSCKAFAGQEAKKEAASTKLQEDAKAHLHSGESVDGDRLPLPKDGE